ncbi:MAG: DNA cytosine methyltransferase, partial [Alphaproteobacteria bacterium]
GEGTRSGLYREVIRIASIVRPRHIFLENVAAITSKSKGYLEIICKDLYEIGYDCRWTTLSASEVGAPHKRDRWWLLAHSKRDKQSREEPCIREAGRMGRIGEQMAWNRDWESALHEFRRMDVRTPYQVDRTDIIRNAQVPLQAAVAYSILEEMFNDM